MSQPTMQEMLSTAKKIDDNLKGQKVNESADSTPAKKVKKNAKPKAKKESE